LTIVGLLGGRGCPSSPFVFSVVVVRRILVAIILKFFLI
jgi:hypothetical protein